MLLQDILFFQRKLYDEQSYRNKLFLEQYVKSRVETLTDKFCLI